IDGLTLAGPNAASFAIESDSGESTLAPGASRTLKLTFTPDNLGNYSATLSLRHGDHRVGSPHSVLLTGSGIIPSIRPTVNSMAFGNQRVGTESGEQTVRIDNIGEAPLVIRAIRFEGPGAAQYRVSDPTAVTILPDESHTFAVRFAPDTRGAANAE